MIPNIGERAVLEAIASIGPYLHLLGDDVAATLTADVTWADLQPHECAWPGYAAQPLTWPSSWDVDADGRTWARYPEVAWALGETTGSSHPVWGWALTVIRPATGEREVLVAHAWATPVYLAIAGDEVAVTPELGLRGL